MGGPMVLTPPGGWARTFSSLRLRDFRIYWIGMLFSFIGMQMGMIARQWLVYDLTGSTTALGVVGAFSAIPMLLLSIPGGVVADRVRKKNLLLAAQTITGVLAFTMNKFCIQFPIGDHSGKLHHDRRIGPDGERTDHLYFCKFCSLSCCCAAAEGGSAAHQAV